MQKVNRRGILKVLDATPKAKTFSAFDTHFDLITCGENEFLNFLYKDKNKDNGIEERLRRLSQNEENDGATSDASANTGMDSGVSQRY